MKRLRQDLWLTLPLFMASCVATLPVHAATCDAYQLASLKVQAQTLNAAGVQAGELLIRRCPKIRSEALQWTAFLLTLLGQRDRAHTLDRLLMPPPRGKGVTRVRTLAEAGSYIELRQRLSAFDKRYTKDVSNHLVLGRALARSGDFDAARREYFTYIAKRPQDASVRTEYLYLNVWADQGAVALAAFKQALAGGASRDTAAASERGVELVYKLWPQLKPSDPAGTLPVRPVAAATPVSLTPAPAPSPTAVPPTETTASVQKTSNPSIHLNAYQDVVAENYRLAQARVYGLGFSADPSLTMIRTEYQALEDATSNSGWFQLGRTWEPVDGLSLNSGAGWFAAPKSGSVTAHLSIEFSPAPEVFLGAGISRTPLAADIPLIKEDQSVARDVVYGELGWRGIADWRGSLMRENESVAHEHHAAHLRWAFMGDCTKAECAEVLIPLRFERYQRLSPYFYHDNDRRGAGLGLATKLLPLPFVLFELHGEALSWNALTPGRETEDYSTRTLGGKLSWKDLEGEIGISYDARFTSSPYKFRKREVPHSAGVFAHWTL